LLSWRHQAEKWGRLSARWIKFHLRPPRPFSPDFKIAEADPGDKTLILFIPSHIFGHAPLEGYLRNAKIPPEFEISMDLNRLAEASAVVFHVPDIQTLDGLPKFPGQLWIGWSNECPVHRPLQNFLDRFDLSIGYKSDADVFSLYLPSEAELRHAAQAKVPGKMVSFFASNPVEYSGRTAYAARLMRYIRVDSFGKCLNNQKLVNDGGWDSKLDMMGRYKFDLSFENAIDEDYVSEKFFQPLLVGTVPVYLGAPNVSEYAPGENCFINCNDYKDPRELAEYLLFLDSSDDEYARYLAWKKKPFRDSFLTLAGRLEEHSFSRLFAILHKRLKQSPVADKL